MLAMLNRTADAIAAYERLIEITPDSAEAWFRLGVLRGESGQHELACQAYGKVIELQPDAASAWFNKGLNEAQLGRYEDAIQAYERAIAINPEDAASWSEKGNVLRDLGRIDEAITAHRRAIEVQPEYIGGWYNLACDYALREDKASALVYLQRAIHVDESLRELAKQDKDFRGLWKDEVFRQLVAAE
jgi:tetratricopeptide (TPR) repeat protein